MLDSGGGRGGVVVHDGLECLGRPKRCIPSTRILQRAGLWSIFGRKCH